MEPPTKRVRLSRPEELVDDYIKQDRVKRDPFLILPASLEKGIGNSPTPTIRLSDFKPRAVYADGDNVRRRDSPGYIVARSPEITITASMLNVVVVEFGSTTRVTQIPIPSVDTTLAIGSLGSLTIAGISEGQGTITGSGSITRSAGLPSTITGLVPTATDLSSISTSANETSSTSNDHTITVTSTSNIAVTYTNGTFLSTQPTGSNGTFTASTTDLMTTLTSSSLYHFGDPVSSSGVTTSTVDTKSATFTGAPTGTVSAPAAASSTDVDSSPGPPGITLTPQQQQVVGGVVGGVAGVALVLLALLYVLKWYRQHLTAQGRSPRQISDGHDFDGNDDHVMLSRGVMAESTKPSVIPMHALASRLNQFRPRSFNTSAKTLEILDNEKSETDRGFQRLAGRKIPSVLSHGGDGYGDHYGAFTDHNATAAHSGPTNGSATSPPNDPFADPPVGTESHGDLIFMSPTTSTTNLVATTKKDTPAPDTFNFGLGSLRAAEGYATLRPSPARTPVTSSPTGSSFPFPQAISTPPLLSGDVPDLPRMPVLHFSPSTKHDTSNLEQHSQLRRGRSHVQHESQSGEVVMSRASVGGLTASARSFSTVSGKSVSTGGRFREEI